MTSLTEEILLVALDEKRGKFPYFPEYGLELALSGAVLMDLALHDRIDADSENLIVVNDTPTGDDILDPVLREIARSQDRHTLREWILKLAKVRFFRERALERLVEKGILRCQRPKLLGPFWSTRYPAAGEGEQFAVKTRVIELLFSEEIPDPRDVVLICLGNACGLFAILLGRRDHSAASERIERISRMDLIGQKMLGELRDLQAFMNSVGYWGVEEDYALEMRIRGKALA